MSEMSYLEKLLDGVEVEWKAVGDIAGYSPTKVDADKLDATSFVGVDNLLADKGGRIDATYQPNTARLTAYEPGDILLGNIRPYLKKVWMAENNGGCSGDVLAIRILADCKKIISPEYLYYALSSDSFFSYSMQHAKGAKMPRGSKDAILNYQIPIPCPSAPEKSLAIQSEIVRILDKFTALTAELTAELTMRKKQYNYYRDQLLSFEGGSVEWKSLGEVAIITIGAFVRKDKQNPDADYPVYNGGRTPTGYYEDFNNDGDKIIVSARGANAGFVNKSSTPYWAGNSC
ncbi:TPA: restriction endonuclease subunit S, partial [Klebsiella pneumoniae]